MTVNLSKADMELIHDALKAWVRNAGQEDFFEALANIEPVTNVEGAVAQLRELQKSLPQKRKEREERTILLRAKLLQAESNELKPGPGKDGAHQFTITR